MLLHGFKNLQQKHTLKQCFEETQVNNTPFRLAVPFAVLYIVARGGQKTRVIFVSESSNKK